MDWRADMMALITSGCACPFRTRDFTTAGLDVVGDEGPKMFEIQANEGGDTFEVAFSGASSIVLDHWAPDASIADVSTCDNAPTETTTSTFSYLHTICDKAGGIYQALYTATVSGAYNITLRYNGEFFRNSPVATLVNPAIAYTVTNATQCFACIAGTADTDNDASTVCVACTSGEQARDGHTCETCSSGATDHDADPATPCAECPNGQYNDEAGFVGQCTGCPVGFAGNGTGLQTESAACVPCPAGKWSQEVGSPTCGACPVPTYRGLGDRGGCQPCNRQEYRCNSSGLAHPSAAPGYFLNPAKLTQLIFDVVFDVSMIEECTPFVACAGACPAAALEQAPPAYDQCPGGVGEQSCSAGYTGDRCSACWEFDPGLQCTDTTPNGYYRLDGRCEPCPCGGVSMSVILGLCAVGLLVFMFLMDFVMQKVKHISTIVAPFMIILTFCQTVALLLDLEVTWPPQLRILMQQLNVLNINIELARPECTGPFGVAEKMNLTLAMPVALCLLLLVYAALKSVHARCHETVEHFQAAHQGKTPVEFVIQQCTVIVSTVFVSCSIFFLRNVLNVFNCHYDPLTGSKYLKVEPEIECNTDDMGGEYAVLRFRAWVGLLAYCGVYAAFVVGSKINRELFSFLGDKFEDKWYFWELVLVARKVGIMTSFLFFNRTPAQSWLFGSMIITGSLVAHAFARPCEYLVSVSIYMYVQR